MLNKQGTVDHVAYYLCKDILSYIEIATKAFAAGYRFCGASKRIFTDEELKGNFKDNLYSDGDTGKLCVGLYFEDELNSNKIIYNVTESSILSYLDGKIYDPSAIKAESMENLFDMIGVPKISFLDI